MVCTHCSDTLSHGAHVGNMSSNLTSHIYLVATVSACDVLSSLNNIYCYVFVNLFIYFLHLFIFNFNILRLSHL